MGFPTRSGGRQPNFFFSFRLCEPRHPMLLKEKHAVLSARVDNKRVSPFELLSGRVTDLGIGRSR